MMKRNAEGYPDPTAGTAISRTTRQSEKEKMLDQERQWAVGEYIRLVKQIAEFAGFEEVGRITLRDKHTGKEYR